VIQIIEEHEGIKFKQTMDNPPSDEVKSTYESEHKFVVFKKDGATTQFISSNGNLYSTKQIGEIKCNDIWLQPVAHLNNGESCYLGNQSFKRMSDCEQRVKMMKDLLEFKK
jgi:hypothetical protein